MSDRELLLPLSKYDTIIVSYSGGKDSLACLLLLLDLGAPREKCEVWHQCVDGDPFQEGQRFMDWPCTTSYVQATAAALGIPCAFQWRDGGFERELMRDGEKTAGVWYWQAGSRTYLATVGRSRPTTRLKFPQKTANLSVRWCSPALKIDVAARVICNQSRFVGKKTLFVTGERAQESTARSKYLAFEPHRTDCKRRRVDHFRAVLELPEADVWAIIERWRVHAHPAYYLGWGRVSCQHCIFADKDQWASSREIDPAGVAKIGELERRFGLTITPGRTVGQMADAGDPFVKRASKEMVDLAMSPTAFTKEMFFLPAGRPWVLPSGAYKRCGGPT